MIKMIIVAHGELASGLLSALELIVGKQEQIEVVNFSEGMSPKEFKEKLKGACGAPDVIVLSDLLGGTPFKVSVELTSELVNQNIAVLAGTNLAMLIEASLMRLTCEFDELVNRLVEVAKENVIDAQSLYDAIELNNTVEEGI